MTAVAGAGQAQDLPGRDANGKKWMKFFWFFLFYPESLILRKKAIAPARPHRF